MDNVAFYNNSIFPQHKQIRAACECNETPNWMVKRVYEYVEPRQQNYDGIVPVGNVLRRNPPNCGITQYTSGKTQQQLYKERVRVINNGINNTIYMNKIQLDLSQPNMHQVRPLGPTFMRK